MDLATGDSIVHGAQKTFTFNITAPSAAGTYDFQWRMLQEGVTWFGDFTSNVAIVVTARPGSARGTFALTGRRPLAGRWTARRLP